MATVLVVDDHRQNVELLTTILEYGKHRILEAANGAEALLAAQREHPDLVITDILMPVMDGFEFVRRLREERDLAGTPVMFYTATYLERDVRALAETCGVHHVLTKPADPDLVLNTVHQVLGLPAVPQFGWELPHPGPLDQLRQALPQETEGLQALGMRLLGLLDLGLGLEHDIGNLIRTHCREGRKILAARYAGAADYERKTGQLDGFITDGVDDNATARAPAVTAGPLAEVAADGQARRLRISSADQGAAWLPPGHPPVDSLLAVPCKCSTHVSKVLYFAGKIGESGFSEDDERIAAMLGLQLAMRCENARLFGEVESRTAQLEIEVRERRRAEKETLRLNEELLRKIERISRYNADLEEFAYAASHDLKEPLRTIHTYTQLLVRRVHGAADPQMNEFADFICHSAERLRALLDGLLAYSSAGQAPAELACVDGREVLEEVLETLREAIAASCAVVRAAPFPLVLANRTQLRQIFLNLVGNGLKYRRPGVPPRIGVSAKAENSLVRFAISDNGLGVGAEHREKIFKLFRRLHGEEYPGVGVGLALCRRLVEGNGGRIWLESQPGQGSTFYFTLPAATAPVRDKQGD